MKYTNMNNGLNFDIEKIEKCFRIVEKYRLHASFSLETIRTSEICIHLLNNTKEGNIFQTCLNGLYLNCIVNIRKILEPNKNGKKCNLDFLINTIYENKDFFAKRHYDSDYNKERHSMSDYEAKGCLVLIDCNETIKHEFAERCREKCLNEIENVKRQWDNFKDSNDRNTLKICRDNLVHSFDIYPIDLPNTNDLERVLRIITDFISCLEFIIMNSSSNTDELDKEINRVSTNFWKKIQ